jgi:uncharacterized protein YoxC
MLEIAFLDIAAIVAAFSLLMVGIGVIRWANAATALVSDYRAFMKSFFSEIKKVAGDKLPVPDEMPEWLK